MAEPDTSPIDPKVVKRVTEDGKTIEFHSPTEQENSTSTTSKTAAAKKPHFGVRFTRIIPPPGG